MKKLLIIPAVLAVAFAVAMLTMSGDWTVSRTQVVHGSPAEINAVVERLASWPEWSYWSKEQDPEAVLTFTGPESGVGCTWSWESDGKLDIGKIVVTSSSATEGMTYELEMPRMTMLGRLDYKVVEGGTEVSFASSGNSGGWMKIFTPFVDSMVGPSYEASLQGLDSYMLAQAMDAAESAESAAVEANSEK